MSDKRVLMPRRDFLTTVPLGVLAAATAVLHPSKADAAVWGIFFRGVIYGIGTTVGAAIATEALSSVGGGYSPYYYYRGRTRFSGVDYYSTYAPTGWKEHIAPKPVIITASFDPKKRVSGDVLRVRAIQHNISRGDAIALPEKGKLVIEEDGKLLFADADFKGHAYIQQGGDLNVWTKKGNRVMTRAAQKNCFHNFCHDSTAGRLAMHSLLGEVRHA